MAQLLVKWPMKVLFGRLCVRAGGFKPQSLSLCSSVLASNRTSVISSRHPLTRSITTTSVNRLRRRRGDDDDDGNLDDDAPQSMAHAMRREQQLRREKERMQKPGTPGRLAHYQESSEMGVEPEDEMTVLSLDPDDLYKELRRMDAGTLLQTMEENHEKLEPVHFPVALRRLNQVRRQEREPALREKFVKDVLDDNAFQIICAYLAKYGAEYDKDIMVDMLVFLRSFELDSDHLTVKVFLELLKHVVPNLALDQMIEVASTASTMTPTGQTRLLISALELLAGNRFDEVEVLDANACVSMLNLFGQSLKPNTMSALLSELRQQIQNVSWKHIPTLLQTLDRLKLEDVDDLYQEALDTVVTQNQRYTLDELTDVLDIMVRQRIYCPELVDCVAERAVHGEDVGVMERIAVARLLHRQEYAHLGLLLGLARELAGKNEVREIVSVGEAEVGDLKDLLHCWADAHFMIGRDAVTEAVGSIMEILAENVAVFMPDDVLDMCVHAQALQQDIPDSLSQHLFSQQCVDVITENYSQKDIAADSISRTDLLIAVHSHCSTEPMPDIDTIKQRDSAKTSIAADIEKILGEKHVLYNRKAQNGLSVAMQVELDPDEKLYHRHEKYQIPVEKELDFVQRVAVLPLRGEYFSRMTGQMKSETVVFARALQKLKYYVTVINLNSYDKVQQSSRYNYVKDKIRGAAKYQDLLMMGLDNLNIPQATNAE